MGLKNPTNRSKEVPAKVRILIGEIAYNLVAALDYLVFVLARHDSGIEQERTQFPVHVKKEGFTGRRKTELKGVGDEHVALIEALQPYNGCTWTKRLKDLNNLDKHRKLVQVGATALRLFSLGTDVAREAAKTKRWRPRAGLPELPVKVYLGGSLSITLDDGSPVVKSVGETEVAGRRCACSVQASSELKRLTQALEVLGERLAIMRRVIDNPRDRPEIIRRPYLLWDAREGDPVVRASRREGVKNGRRR